MKYPAALVAFTLLLSRHARAGDVPEDVIQVHIDGEGAELRNRKTHATVCVAPCDTFVPRRGEYFIFDGRESRPFLIDAVSEAVDVTVQHETHSRQTLAVWFFGGSLVIAAGLGALGVALSTDTQCSGSSWFCLSPAGFAPLVDALAVMVGVAGGLTALTLALVPKKTTTVHVTPMIAASAGGGSLGLHASF